MTDTLEVMTLPLPPGGGAGVSQAHFPTGNKKMHGKWCHREGGRGWGNPRITPSPSPLHRPLFAFWGRHAETGIG